MRCPRAMGIAIRLRGLLTGAMSQGFNRIPNGVLSSWFCQSLGPRSQSISYQQLWESRGSHSLEFLPTERGFPTPPLNPVAMSFISLHFRSEEHTSELQSHSDLVCRLLLE